MEHTITRRLNSTLDELSAEFSITYCDRDFRRVLKELKDSDEGNWYENLNKLLRMLKKCGFAYRPTGKQDYTFYKKLVTGLIEQGVIVSSDKMSKSILSACEKLFEKHREYPTPTAYMQRLVDRLCFPEDPWQEDSLRLRILKQFIKYGNYLMAAEIGKKKPIQSYVGIKLSKEKVTDAEVLEQLDDNIYAMIVIPSTEEIELAMRKAASSAQPEAPGKALRELILNAENAGLPSSFDAQDYQAAVDLLLHSSAIEQLTERILIQHAAEVLGRENVTKKEASSALGKKVCTAIFRSLSEGVNRAVMKSETRNSIIKSMAGKLKDKQITAEKLQSTLYSALHKAIRKQNNEDYLLLRVSNDLASGQFRTNGATKRNLYLFALVFHMTYHSPAQKGTVYDAMRDVEKNLFTDYYAANVLQYLSATYLKGRTNGEIIPSGCSINYKNYAEMIYLYYICQDYQRMPADEKLKRAAKMIEAVKVRGRNLATPDTQDRQDGATHKMKELVVGHAGLLACEDVMALSEEDFLDFIVRHYDRRANIDNTDISPFQVNAEDHTALTEYTRIVRKLMGSSDETKGSSPFDDYMISIHVLQANVRDKDYDDAVNRDLQREFSYGLTFDEAHWQADKAPDSIDQDFQQLLVSVDKLVRNWLDKPEEINRTKLLAALYYDFNERYAFDRDDRQGRSFQEHYALFRKEINPVLEKCNYALLSSKSLLDVLIVFSSYIYLNT